jgi:hypothetical protein
MTWTYKLSKTNKNSVEGLNSILGQVKNRISGLEGKAKQIEYSNRDKEKK